MWCTLLTLLHGLIFFASGQTIPDVLSSNPRINLAYAFTRQGQPEKAARQYDAAIRESAKDDPLIHGHILNAAASFYHEMGNFQRAETYLKKSLAIWKEHAGPDHISLAPMVNRLACVYIETGAEAKAERLHLNEWIARLAQQTPGSNDHVNLLGTYATLLAQQKRYAEAQQYSQEALSQLTRRGEGESLDAVAMVNNLGLVSLESGNLPQARQYLERADEMLRHSPSGHAFYQAVNRTLLARIAHKEKRYDEAEKLLNEAITLVEVRCGPNSLRTAILLVEYTAMLREQKRKAEAREMEARVKAILQASGFSASSATVDAATLAKRR